MISTKGLGYKPIRIVDISITTITVVKVFVVLILVDA
jgi:hypothetical protein